MPPTKRRLLTGVFITTGFFIGGLVLFFVLQWRQALDNINAMIVTPVVLPSANEGNPEAANPAAPIAVTQPLELIGPPQNPNQPVNPGPGAVPAGEPEETNLTETLPEFITDDATVNILLLGTDARPDDLETTRTDAIVLVHLNQQSGKVSMLSLPRDLWVKYPGHGEGRINAAYLIGEKRFGPGGGAALAKLTVSKLVGMRIDYFLLINFEGFRTLIDQIGGIQIDVPTEIIDTHYPTENYGYIEVRFAPGRQWMNGERALIYARTRHADSDFARNQRQQQVLMAIFQRVRDQGLLQQFTSFDDYTGALRNYVRTDMSRQVMLSLANWGRGLRAENVRRFAVDASVIVPLEAPATFAVRPRELRRIVAKMTGETSGSAGGE